MWKPLTMSVSLAFALLACGVVQAGGGKHLPSPQVAPSKQAVAPSAQEVYPTAQGHHGIISDAGHCGFCLPKLRMPKLHMPKIHLPKISLPKPKPRCYTYEWVLKKKRCGGGLLGMFGHGSCDHGHGPVHPTGQHASPQGDVYGSGQADFYGDAYGSGQADVYGAGQMYGTGQMAPAEGGEWEGGENGGSGDGDAAPEAPAVPSSYSPLGSTSLFGTPR